MTGQQISHYKILEKLGEGGMGAVYRAQDMRLLRDVAIKLLRPELMKDKKKRLRFIKEAQTASSLNHPNICTIHDISEEDSQHFIVMELVEGENLRELLEEENKLPEQQLIDISIHICEALVAVHQKGISHRDIKPENIMITRDGRVKVMDFGIAKLATEYVESVVEMKGAEDWRQDYLDSVVDTNLSGFLGTVHYMSPEQAQGGSVDPRSDIFSFGVMLYELATGQKPFMGESNLTILTKIIKENALPDPDASGLSQGLQKILSGALQKEAEKRYQSVRELLEDLEQLKIQQSSASGPGKERIPSGELLRRPGRGIVLYGTVAAAIIAAIAIYLTWNQDQKEPFPLMQTTRFTSFPGNEVYPAFSPDGESIAFSWNGPDQNNMDIYVKRREGADPVRLTRSKLADYMPAWSGDGEHIAFVRPVPDKIRAYDIYMIPSEGGKETKVYTIHPMGNTPFLSWGKNNEFLYFSKWSPPSESVAVFRISVKTKEVEQVTFPPRKDVGDFSPAISPDGKYLGHIRRRMRGDYDLYIRDLESDETRQVTRENTEIQGYIWGNSSRSILFAANRDGTSGLWKTDLNGTIGEKVLSGTSVAHPSYSHAAKSIVYQERITKGDIWKMDLDNPENQVMLISSSSAMNINPEISPDGNRLVFSSNRTGTHNIWISNMDGTGQSQLTFFDKYVRAGDAHWSPKNDEVLVHFGRFQSYVVNLSTGQVVTHSDLDAHPLWAANGSDFYMAVYPETNLYFVSGDGTVKTKLTKDLGLNAKLEGDFLYYFKHFDHREIWRIGLDGTREEPVLQGVDRLGIGAWDVVSTGLYYYSSLGNKVLSFYEFESGKSEEIAPLPGVSSIAVDPDEEYLLYSKSETSWSDLILVENVTLE